MDGRTRSSSLPPARNPRATASVVAGLAAVGAVPAGVAASRYVDDVTLLQSTGSVPLAALLGLIAVVLARRARERVTFTLGRAGGASAARLGRALGILGIWVAVTAALALGFFGLLTLFAE